MGYLLLGSRAHHFIQSGGQLTGVQADATLGVVVNAFDNAQLFSMGAHIGSVRFPLRYYILLILSDS